METVPYLSVCLNTLNLPIILENQSNPVTKFLSGLSVIPSHMKLSNGYTLHDHLELLAAANPSQKYLLNKQGYTFDEIKSELLKFQKSGGYLELRDEYKAVGTDFSRPHKYLQASVTEKTGAPPAQPAPELKEALPDKLLEPDQPAALPNVQTPEEPRIASSTQGQSRPSSSIQRIQYTPTTPPKAEEPPKIVKADAPPQPVTPSPPRIIKTVLPTPIIAPAISKVNQTPVVMAPQPLGQGQVRPNRNIRPLNIPQPVQGGLKSVGSKAGILTQRATNVTIPNLVGGLVKDTASSMFGFIPGSRNSSPGLVSRGIGYLRGGRSAGGGGRGSFIGQFLPTSDGGKKSWLWILMLLFFILFVLYFFFGGPMEQLSDKADIKNIEITKLAPQAVENGAKITYNITVRNKGTSPAQVVVTDDVPQNTTYDSGNNDPVASGSGKVVKNLRWTMKGLPGGQVQNLTFSVYPTKEDVWVINQAKASVSISGGNGSVPISGNIPPTQDNCKGTYNLTNPLGNFGDPECSFKKDDLYTLLKQLDATNADYWFLKVVRCESDYNPNTWRDPNILPKTPDPAGAWGLFQMGRGRGGENDHGDVIWQQQASNAVSRQKQVGWGYWACAGG